MKSLERSRRNADLDQVDPEHLSHETAEFSWDDLSREPFSGSQNNDQANHVEKLKLLLDDLSPDENRRVVAVEEARQRVLDSMQKVGSFGQNYLMVLCGNRHRGFDYLLIYPPKRTLKRPNETASMMSPAVRTPASTAIMVFLKSSFKILAARVPVQAPVPGIGIATKR